MPATAYHPTCQALLDKHYKDVPHRDTILNGAIRSLLRPTDTMLDAGCGSTLPFLELHGGSARFCVGIDVERPCVPVPPRTAVALANLAGLPFPPATFDLVISRSVVEHLADPVSVMGEIARVLKPGGRFVFTTPNRFYYSSLIAGAVPYWLKDFYMRRTFGETAYDHFPAFYRANTRRAIYRVAGRAGLRVERLDALRHFPFYFPFSPLLFRLGMLYDHAVTRLHLDSLQSTWLVVLARP
jgi:SAM-dependent methyltransferase